MHKRHPLMAACATALILLPTLTLARKASEQQVIVAQQLVGQMQHLRQYPP